MDRVVHESENSNLKEQSRKELEKSLEIAKFKRNLKSLSKEKTDEEEKNLQLRKMLYN